VVAEDAADFDEHLLHVGVRDLNRRGRLTARLLRKVEM
jgi:hypothetical protein